MPEADFKKTLSESLLKPSELMRVWHPDLFPETISSPLIVLDKAVLEYHLETLTNRKQEQVFEEFCRRITELEICPNLKPQTGPTGGGDSKVDASTYPVAQVLIDRCYFGTPNPPSTGEWAFAFSCKKSWKAKVIEDIGKIATVGRAFEKVFFISNQFIRDKIRAKVELQLREQYGFDVHILDRTWILTTVFDHNRQDIAIEMLNIGISKTEGPKLGPRDVNRQERLDSLLKRLGQPELYFGNDYALAHDYLQAAKLARNLQKSRHEIDGLFVRARSLAQKSSDKSLVILCGYHHAWTSLWWFDDPLTLENIYSELIGYLPGTDNAEDCELFHNLWLLLYASKIRGHINIDQSILDSRLSEIKKEVKRMAQDIGRPNNALHAETILHFIALTETLGKSANTKPAFEGLQKCLRRSEGLGTYPAMQFIDNLAKLSNVFEGLAGYDELFEEMRNVARRRSGETSEGKLLFERGMQLIDKGNPRDVLRYLGQARIRLCKEETMEESIWAALGCASAYMEMGLYWAARIEALITAHVALRTRESRYDFPVEGLLAAKLLGWIELRLARIGPFLAWHRLSQLLVGYLRSLQYEVGKFEEALLHQEAVLGCFFLNLDPEDAKELRELKNGLAQNNLPLARLALLYAIKEEDLPLSEIPKGLAETKEELGDFLRMLKNQPAADQLPRNLAGETRSYWNYETAIMNVRYRLKTRNYLGPVLFSENLLGIIEAALALAEWSNLAFIIDEVPFLIDVNESGNNPPKLNLDGPPAPEGYEFMWRRDMLKWLKQVERSEITAYFMELLLKVLLDTTIDPLDDLKEEMDRWHKEDTFSRAIGTSPTSVAVTDILGDDCYDLRHWS